MKEYGIISSKQTTREESMKPIYWSFIQINVIQVTDGALILLYIGSVGI